MNILVLDIGTTSMRGMLFGPQGDVLITHSIATPLVYLNDTVEQLPNRFTDGVVEICRVILLRHQIDAISITALRSSLCLVDHEGKALCNFIMWQDTRNRAINSRFLKDVTLIQNTSGAAPNTVFTATRLLWLRENEPDLYNQAFKAMVVPDYLLHFMTNEFVTDRTYGSRTHLMNIQTLEWDDDLCRLFSVDRRLLCQLIDQGSVAGRTTTDFSLLTGIQEGTPVISAGGDQQCCMLGLGIFDSSILEINCGTGSFALSMTEKPTTSVNSLICNVSAIVGKYIIESNVLASSSALDWMIKELFPDYWKENPDFAAIDRLVEQSPIGANGVFCLPHFQGCGTRDWNPNAKAILWGLTFSNTRNDIARALYEGIASEISKSVSCLPSSCKCSKSALIAGGLTNSHVFNQILSDMLDLELHRWQNPQATAIGAWISAAKALGLYKDYETALHMARSSDNSSRYSPSNETVVFYRAHKKRTEHVHQLNIDHYSNAD